MNNRNQQPSFVRVIKKFFLSAFVVLSFVAYSMHDRSAFTNNNLAQATQARPALTQPLGQATAQQAPTQPAAPTQPPAPTETPAPSQLIFNNPAPTSTPQISAQNGQYKDGTYKGSQVDVNWGLVQVQVVIKNEKINNVQFLQYPQDRRTSQRINSFAVPELQQEAVQAQSANVNLISGATLTSEGFQMSLQDALNQAKG